MPNFPALFPDVSNNQALIDGIAARNEGMAAIAAKVSEGSSFVDVLAAGNYHQAMLAGLPFLGYHFIDPGDGAAQADHFLDCLSKAGIPVYNIAIGIDRENCDGPTADAFIARIRSRVPNHPHFIGYEAAWVVDRFGASAGMDSLGLWWSNYVNGSGSPQGILAGVTPGWFAPFGGHTRYVTRQYTDAADVGGENGCDCSVIFDQADWDAIFASAVIVPVGPTPPPVPAPQPGALTVDGIFGAQTVAALQEATGAQPVDGIFGPQSKMALQRCLGVTADSIIGPITIEALQRHVGAGVDGVWGRQTTSDLQMTLNDHRF